MSIMQLPIQNRIHLTSNWGLFVGKFDDNKFHKHYAQQISISILSDYQITDYTNCVHQLKSCFIQSNIVHRFKSNDTTLILLINPISSLGHQLDFLHMNKKIDSLDPPLSNHLTCLFSDYCQNKISFSQFTKELDEYLLKIQSDGQQNNHFKDDRIYNAILFLDKNYERIVSLKEIAAYCFVSETRFLHLFKQKTNVNYRQYQLWNKMMRSIAFLSQNTITSTAHQFGFVDSSHYTRTFKETFGILPKTIIRTKQPVYPHRLTVQ